MSAPINPVPSERRSYREGRQLALNVASGVRHITPDTIRYMAVAPDEYVRGFNDALAGAGHREARDEVTLHRISVTQLVDAIEGLSQLDDAATRQDCIAELGNVLPHLKLALSR